MSSIPIFVSTWLNKVLRHGQCVKSIDSIYCMKASQILKHIKSCAIFLKPTPSSLQNSHNPSQVAAPTLTPEEVHKEDSDISEVNSPGDDTIVPLDTIIDAMHGNLDIDDCFMLDEDGLESTAEAEETLVEEVEGVKINTTHLVSQLEGHGHQIKMKSKFYLDELLRWWAEGKNRK